MNRYLTKIAKINKENKPDYFEGGLKGAAVAAAGASASSLGSLPLLSTLDNKPSVDKSTLKKILKSNKDLNTTFSLNKAMKGNKPAVGIMKEIVDRGGPSFVNDGVRSSLHKILSVIPSTKEHAKHINTPMAKNYIHMGSPFSSPFGRKRVKNIDVALHELGHAKDFAGKSKFVNSLKQTSYGVSSRLHSLGIGAVAGGMMLQNDKTKDYAWTAPVIAAAPMLRGEAAANYHGYKMLKQHGTSAMKNSFLKNIAGKNMLSYGSGVGVGALALYAMNKLNNPKKDSK